MLSEEREVEEVLRFACWSCGCLEKLMFQRDKSTFGALAVPGTYPCGVTSGE